MIGEEVTNYILKLGAYIYAIDHTFYGFTGVVTHFGCWENTRKACQSRAEGKKEMFSYEFTGTINHRFLTNQNARL